MANEYKLNGRQWEKEGIKKKSRKCWDKKAIVWRKKMRIIREVNIEKKNTACYLQL